MAESIVDFQIRSMMCAPLVGSDGKALGVIQIDTLDQRNRFRQDDLDVLASVACQAAFAVENAQLHEAKLRQQALERELAMAHEVQQGFLPDGTRSWPATSSSTSTSRPTSWAATTSTTCRCRTGGWAVVVADVSGKGISAALLMARLSAEIRYGLASCRRRRGGGPGQPGLLRRTAGRTGSSRWSWACSIRRSTR